MKRSLSIVMVLVAGGSFGVSLSSCNAPACGPGTVQQQQKNGDLKCVPVDQQEAGIACDIDAGNVTIVGGKCVSAVQCDPATTVEVNGICVGNGTTATTCSTPMTGKACVAGKIVTFSTDNKPNTTPVHVEVYDAVGLLNGGGLLGMTDSSDGGSYVISNFTPPQLGTIVIMTGRTNATMIMAGTGGQNITAGNSYRIDAYAVTQTEAAGWGFDITTGGAYIARYYKDTKPDPTKLIINETMPAPNVTMIKDFAPAAGAKYFNDTLTAVDGTLTVTGASGAAIVASPIPMGGTFPSFSGMGGGVPTWETLPGGSAAGLVIITRFHPGP